MACDAGAVWIWVNGEVMAAPMRRLAPPASASGVMASYQKTPDRRLLVGTVTEPNSAPLRS